MSSYANTAAGDLVSRVTTLEDASNSTANAASTIDEKLATKANVTVVDAKADKSYVDDELDGKATVATVNAKADKSYVDDKLDGKASADQFAAMQRTINDLKAQFEDQCGFDRHRRSTCGNNPDDSAATAPGTTAGIVVAGVLVLVAVLVALFFWWRRKHKNDEANMAQQLQGSKTTAYNNPQFDNNLVAASRCQACGVKRTQCVCRERAESIAQGNIPKFVPDEYIDVDGKDSSAATQEPLTIATAVTAPWFVHEMDKGECKARVLAADEPGSFLVRISRKTPGAYAFCMNLGNGRVQEDLAKPDRRGKLALYFANSKKGTPLFPDLQSLVEHCQTNTISPAAGIDLKLGEGAPVLPPPAADGAQHSEIPQASDAVYSCVYGEVDAGLLEFYNRVVVSVHEIYDAHAENPLAPLDSQPPVSFADAINAAEAHCGTLQADVAEARAFADLNGAVLSQRFGIGRDAIMIIYMYTKECNLYKKMNAALGNYGDEVDPRSKLVHYLPFVQLLKSALAMLPKVKQIVYRGINLPYTTLLNGARVGDTIQWWSFVSTTVSPSVLRAKEFMHAAVSIADGKVADVQNLDSIYGNVAPEQKTIFQIDVCDGAEVKPFSAVQGEDEVLLAAGSEFLITGIDMWRQGITEVRMRQTHGATGSTSRTSGESAFNPIDLYMAPDPEVDTNYSVLDGAQC